MKKIQCSSYSKKKSFKLIFYSTSVIISSSLCKEKHNGKVKTTGHPYTTYLHSFICGTKNLYF